MPWGQSVFFLYYLSQQYSQNVVLVANVSVIRSIFVNGKWHIPEGWKGLSNRGLAGAKLEERRLVRFDKKSSSRPLCLCGSRSENEPFPRIFAIQKKALPPFSFFSLRSSIPEFRSPSPARSTPTPLTFY
jgi:hypothetical protein